MYVEIKTWDQMKKEFGEINTIGGRKKITVNFDFTEEMEEAMPESRIINVEKHYRYDEYIYGQWIISNDMIKEFMPTKYVDYLKKNNINIGCNEDA
jgi:hypothetical protein